MDIACLRKNMYDKDLNYIAISYRWGEMNEQLVQTPDYRAHVTSFDLRMLIALCKCIKKEPDLKNIQYLWIDAISVDQLNHERKKETILQMSEIYKRATYILAVPDLHGAHLWKNPANKDAIILIRTHRKIIYKDILNNSNNDYHQLVYEKEKKKNIKNNHCPNHQSSNDKEIQTENEDIKTAYRFLAYLIEDWSNRAWVISEYHIAKEKDESQGTPLKYIFVNLLHDEISTFFSYSFDHHSLTKAININYNNNTNTNKVSYVDVDSPIKFISFLKSKFTQQDHLKMLLESNASRNEDRFNAILPSWKKYNHWIKDKNTVSDWNITDMISVRLKLYELMDDLWDKATLLYACSWSINSPILPSYASQFYSDYLCLFEMENTEIAYDIYLTQLKEISMDTFGNSTFIQHIINNNKKTKYPSLYTENLTNIHLDPCQRRLSIKANKYFTIKNKPLLNQEFLSTCSLKNGDDGDGLCLIWIPFFTFAIPCFTHIPPLIGSGVYLLGNTDQNRWVILSRNKFYRIKMDMSCATNNYTFNIY
ncbi:hypothetical protein BJ944DRAFT_248594 [Cunninghamella echinulata]|nr:hypothetical protein BJ944DRAFT_248594 [Cunninghamella echinulata]